jgi:DNA ligase (NAD+)
MKTLKSKITAAAQAYYSGSPIMSDESFDMLVEQLRNIDPNDELLSTPGWGYNAYSEQHRSKFNHRIFVGSLDKVKIEEAGSHEKLNTMVYCTPKLDGGSAVCYYDEMGNLQRILTRGDGYVGVDVTANLVHTVPTNIGEGELREVRGEIIVTYEDFNEHLDGSHPRNVAIGISQAISPSNNELQQLRFVAYRVYNNGVPTHSHLMWQLQQLQDLGFETPVCYMGTISSIIDSVNNSGDGYVETLTRRYGKSEENIEPNLPEETYYKHFPIDGLVITTIDDSEDSFALKLVDESCVTTVVDIEWEVSRTGRFVPVIVVEPYVIDGVTITRISANNAAWISEMGLGVGATINATRANGVIPHVKSTITRVEIDLSGTVCPECGEPLHMHGRDLICTNDVCPSKINGMISAILNFPEVDGIGPKVIDKMVEMFEITTLSKLAEVIDSVLEVELVSLGFGKSTSAKITQLLDTLSKINPTVKDIIKMCNIPLMGDSLSEDVASSMTPTGFHHMLLEDETAQHELLSSIVNNKTSVANFIKYHSRILDFVDTILGGDWNRISTFEKREMVNASGVKYAVTGSLSKPRKDIVEEFLAFGHEWVDPSKADVLIADGPSSSSKYKTAQKKGIPIINEAQFRVEYMS